MVFDFFKQRTKEGLDQLSNIADAGKRGELGKGLAEAAAYTAVANRKFADGLAKSRNQLLDNMETLLTGVNPEEQISALKCFVTSLVAFPRALARVLMSKTPKNNQSSSASRYHSTLCLGRSSCFH